MVKNPQNNIVLFNLHFSQITYTKPPIKSVANNTPLST